MEKKDFETLTSLEEDILSILVGRGELYGLSILSQLNFDRPTKTLSFGSMYPALNRLNKRGFIKGSWGDDAEPLTGARRKYYKITDDGKIVLNAVREYRDKLCSPRREEDNTNLGGATA
jgi:PadR family transcriptional regulator, regulatory protein PadR